MKILLVSSTNKSIAGGISSWTKSYINYCEKNNHQCTLVNTEYKGKRIYCESSFFIKDELKRLLYIISSLKENLKSNKFDFVHINSSCSCLGIIRDYYIAKTIKKKKRIPLIIQFHCDIEYQINRWPSRFKRISSMYFNKLLKLNACYLTLSKNSYAYLVNKTCKTFLIPNFISSDYVRKNEKPINNLVNNIVFVGHAIKEKGINHIIALANEIKDISFVIIGEANKEVSRQLSCYSNIVYKGICSHENIMYELDNADIFILPSSSEGFSMALLEAMARGVPSIATNVGANMEMIENKGGIIVEKDNYCQLVHAILSMQDSKVRKQMSKWCLQKVLTSYTSKEIFKIYFEIVKKEILFNK